MNRTALLSGAATFIFVVAGVFFGFRAGEAYREDDGYVRCPDGGQILVTEPVGRDADPRLYYVGNCVVSFRAWPTLRLEAGQTFSYVGDPAAFEQVLAAARRMGRPQVARQMNMANLDASEVPSNYPTCANGHPHKFVLLRSEERESYSKKVDVFFCEKCLAYVDKVVWQGRRW